MSVKNTIESSIADVLRQLTAGNPAFSDVSIYEAQRSGERVHPCVIVGCAQAERQAPDYPIYRASVAVIVRTSIDEDTDDVDPLHAERVAAIESAFEDGATVAGLVQGAHCYGAWFDNTEAETDGRVRADTVNVGIEIQL